MLSRNLLKKVALDYPAIRFKPGEHFKWSSTEKIIYYDALEEDAETFLFHELAHAVLDHDDFKLDVELVRKEAKAWEYTASLSEKYGITSDKQKADEALESYRYWLFKRSKCPDCGANGLQTKNTHYKCLACGCNWSANDARICGLKRYKVKTT